MNELLITIPGIPPSVNHYVKHTRNGRHYVTAQAKKFKEDMRLLVGAKRVESKQYELEAHIYLGHGDRLDGDNAWKCLADSLVEAGAIHSDAAVMNWLLYKHRDRENPRTVVMIRGIA